MKKIYLIPLILINIFFMCGCWNYKEIDKLAVVAGVAVDEGKDGNLNIVAEVMDISTGDKGAQIRPIYIEADGRTFFDAARSAVALAGKSLYWGHTKVLVVSERVAENGIDRVLDLLVRDAEIRENMWIVISKERTAKEIIQGVTLLEKILSFELDNALRSEKTISRYPQVELFKFASRLSSDKETPFLPATKLVQTSTGRTFEMYGTAIFDRTKLIGYLSEMESKYLLWIRNELKGGVYVMEGVGKTDTSVTLEINKSKTKMKSTVSNGKIMFNINIKPVVYISEIEGKRDFISKEGRNILKLEAEKNIKKEVEDMIRKVQEEYKVDIFGFGRNLEKNNPKEWNNVKDKWKEVFPFVETNVSVDVEIRGSATIRTPVVKGD